MKAKKLVAALALVLGLSSLAGCAGDKTVEFGNYWYSNSANSHETVNETLVYDFYFEPDSGTELMDYELAYENGTYTTTFSNETLGDQHVYRFTSTRSIDVIYTLNGESEKVTDTETSEVVFLADLKQSLRPISSKKTLVSHSPSNGNNHSSIETCYSTLDYSIETTYADNGKGTCVITNNSLKEDNVVTKKFTPDDNYTFIDNEQLLIALRAFPSSTTSATVQTYAPFVKSKQNVKISFGDAEDEDAENGRIFKLFENGSTVATERAITYRVATIGLDVSQNEGASQTAWIATAKDPLNNKDRNVMLRFETPLSFGLGTLVYELKSITR